MGGSAFSSFPDPPYTPRMPLAVYQRAVSECNAALRKLFICVATPIEGPEKKDYGDVDILVALDKRLAFPQTPADSVLREPKDLMKDVERELRARYAIVQPAGTSANLAIPWPSGVNEHAIAPEEAPGTGEVAATQEESKPKYIQVDIRICRSVDELYWILYKHAHGDIWNLLGSTIRPFGLTVDEEALWLRIPEIEKFDRKHARVCLTKDPVEILHFLGMRVEGFWDEPFPSVDALFDYTMTCRLFYVRDTSDGDAEGDADEVGVVGGEAGRKKLKSNDRRRMKGRPVYRRWINEFIPALRAEGKFIRTGPGTSIEEMRALVREQAFDRFLVKAEYTRRLSEWRLKRNGEQVKSLIKELVPSTMDPQRRACVVGALKKIILESDISFGFDSSGLRDADGLCDAALVRQFVRDNLEQVGKAGWARQQQRARESMQLKASSSKVGNGMDRLE
ncbi:uncharacterized protein B0H64DRAFT_387196 [Chaetomium fimeti]|uniref:Uncharacterized protein n=1 Tax=Chaetomium fimeti TaxID=1854472 RepID=A0AAE0HM61_9PEZI|nr:hypothetical protein B0H64DRAFT_387196 [Chaetomium fimeti]